MKRKTSPTPATTTTALATQSERPSPVAVYVQAKPAMEPNLRVVLRLLGQPIDIRAFQWQDLRFEHVSAIRKILADSLGPAYARKCLIAVRGVLRVAWKMGIIETDTYQRAIDVEPIHGDSKQAGRMLTPRELLRIFAPASDRDRAILALITFAGLRREEVADLDLDSIEGDAIHVLGKGAKRRDVFLSGIVRKHFDPWLAQRGDAPGPLFWRVRRNGRPIPNRRLSPNGVWRVISDAAREAKVKNVTPHDFRRTFASTLFDLGVDPVTVQKLMGHKDPATTARYDRRGDAKKKAAAQALATAFEGL